MLSGYRILLAVLIMGCGGVGAEMSGSNGVSKNAESCDVDCRICERPSSHPICEACCGTALLEHRLTDPTYSLEGADINAWNTFWAGIRTLKEDGDRPAAKTAFEKVYLHYPDSRWAAQSREMADVLKQMISEDAQWATHESPGVPVGEDLARQLVYRLRDLSCTQHGEPPFVDFLLTDINASCRLPNPGVALMEMGDAAVPALIELLDDRRLLRVAVYSSDNISQRNVLRYQDAAYQILEALAGQSFRNEEMHFTYFSLATETEQSIVKNAVRVWAGLVPKDVETFKALRNDPRRFEMTRREYILDGDRMLVVQARAMMAEESAAEEAALRAIEEALTEKGLAVSELTTTNTEGKYHSKRTVHFTFRRGDIPSAGRAVVADGVVLELYIEEE